MSQPRPVRTGALTILVFLLVQPLVAGLCFAGLAALGAGSMGGTAPEETFSPLMALIFGGLIQIPAAGFTGFFMAWLSHRLRSAGGWLGCGAFLGWLMSSLIVLVPLRPVFAEGVGLALFLAAMTGLPAIAGGLAAAAATLRVRSRPWRRLAAEAFD